MNRILLIFVAATIFACSDNTTTSDGEMVPVPVSTARLEPYDDGSGLIRATSYGSDGIILEQGDYLNGLREGVYTVFYTNGYVKSTMGYVQGKKQGQLVNMDDKGQVLERFTYHQDELNGAYVMYNRSRIKESRTYANGKLHGEVVKYYITSILMERSNYANGQLDGISRWYDQNGANTIAYEYKNGELIGDVELDARPAQNN
jgi:antitoxin component YwqK of YwqJK toxin-antitoxin module